MEAQKNAYAWKGILNIYLKNFQNVKIKYLSDTHLLH